MPRRTRSAGEANLLSPKRRRITDGYDSGRTDRDKALGGSDQAGRRINFSDADFFDKYAALKKVESEAEGELKALSIQLHLEENLKAHHTEEYEQEDLIVRRGQPFNVTVTFNRAYVQDNDRIILQLPFGSRPMESKGSNVRVTMTHSEPANDDDWHVMFQSADGESVNMAVMPASDAAVGRYQIHIETISNVDDESVTNRQLFDQTFIVLFNVWCKGDDVYMADESARNEYVLNDRGRIWTGTRFENGGMPWNFGQFEDSVLEAALYVLNKAELGDGARSNVVKVCRCISAMANSNDDNGILTGRWTDDYPKTSTVPWAWTGSVAIIEEYMKTKRAVKYGQCWVFSGLVTTLMRSLGIPCRSVTNFESAHDSDGSITIDYHWNEDDEPETGYNDSVWNFHVWNEAFFKRSDLPEGYDGWQAFDATPQESSEGVMRCGPAPLKAIREGHVYLPFDAPFIFAEVNGDKVHWLMKKDGSMEVLSKEKNAVGHQISTKAVGSNSLNDLTWDYKYRENTEEERVAVRRAFRYSSRKEHCVYDVPEPDVTFTLIAPEGVSMGDDFTLKVLMKNTTEEVRTVTVRLTAVASYYTGVPSERVGTMVFNEVLAANEEKGGELPITHETYEQFLKPDSMVSVYMKGHVKETKKAYARTQSFRMRKPELELDVPDTAELHEPFSMTIKFTNPLDVKLTGASLHIEAYGITKSRVIHIKKAIGAKAEFSHTIDDLSPTRSGERGISVNFCSDQLTGLTGSADVRVKYSAR